MLTDIRALAGHFLIALPNINTYHMLRNIWKQAIELLDDVYRTESHFGLFGDSVSFGAT